MGWVYSWLEIEGAIQLRSLDSFRIRPSAKLATYSYSFLESRISSQWILAEKQKASFTNEHGNLVAEMSVYNALHVTDTSKHKVLVGNFGARTLVGNQCWLGKTKTQFFVQSRS